MAQILLVEDENSIADTLVFALSREGHHIQHYQTGQKALSAALQTNFELAILDLGLPDMNGFELFSKLRQTLPAIPIIFLTARDNEVDKVAGLEMGADDYVVKPFSPREVAARIRAVLRRTNDAPSANPPPHLPSAKTVGPFLLDKEGMRVRFFNQPLLLTRIEFLLLGRLLEKPARILTRQQLLDDVWPDALELSDRIVDTHIKSLRAKLRAVHASKDFIQTHRGLGYSFEL
ncbi:MAG: two-component system response regulator CreB [Proteobacteria bacterium]|nr:two-component system response regulator CreB [Cystobacterineae bacterium]MCL2258473.1 two-component system response regulator CreB [Cystobacterineae bacterium]MCL2315187.1 two-component system response regulator CreB [Pseudomonadota bacterium]